MTSRTDRIAGILSRLGEKLNKIYEEAAALPDREVVGFAEQRVLAAVQ
ncbi:MAG: hypothetical protein GTN93_31275, partial [Anaerolineae bacterium]|nr:hypothetical protein [Anaerolineae bacterium]NIQ82481.1 hypothetical protein [Anaerolineae bacterium]